MAVNVATQVLEKFGNHTWSRIEALNALDEYIGYLLEQDDVLSARHAAEKKDKSAYVIQSFLYNCSLKKDGLRVI